VTYAQQHSHAVAVADGHPVEILDPAYGHGEDASEGFIPDCW
jgi:hypothetical protein